MPDFKGLVGDKSDNIPVFLDGEKDRYQIGLLNTGT